MGANIAGRHAARRDPRGQFAQVSGSPIDSYRPSRIYRRWMACRRSGVRIPLAPHIVFCQVRCPIRGSAIVFRVGGRPLPFQSASSFMQVRAVPRGRGDLLRSAPRVGSQDAPDQGVCTADRLREPKREPVLPTRPGHQLSSRPATRPLNISGSWHLLVPRVH
jgi:hypothetical protein